MEAQINLLTVYKELGWQHESRQEEKIFTNTPRQAKKLCGKVKNFYLLTLGFKKGT